jgi:cyclopropane fatty-acyl-phospholipid synthase-like methyltransferase
MLLISPLIDSYFTFRLKNKGYREKCYKSALAKKLRLSKMGVILLRNLNEEMSKNIFYHDEFVNFLHGKDYQQAFWESDLGYLWFQGNLQQQNKYFDLAMDLLKLHTYQSHLDVGCGWGELSSKVAKLDFVNKALGIDISDDIIARAKDLNKNTQASYQCIDVLQVNEKFDLITLFGSTDYIPPAIFFEVLQKIILLANKEILIVNSLRKSKFEDSLMLKDSMEVKRYDTGYVHPVNHMLSILKQKHFFSFETKKFGMDSSLTVIKIK